MARPEVFNREEVIDSVIRLFWENGYNGTSMQMLTEATGLNRSSIYNSFGSKRELYQLALRTYNQQSGAMFQKVLLRAENPLEALHMLFDSIIHKSCRPDDNKGCFIMSCKTEMAQQDQKAKHWLNEVQQGGLDFYEMLIADAQEQGLINNRRSALEYAHYLYSAFQGLTMTGILVEDEQMLKGVKDTIFEPMM